MITASLQNYRQSPKKVRLVVDAIRGKKVSDAMDVLTLVPKRSAAPIQKLLKSALANASHNHNVTNVGDLFIKEIRVDEGITYHRFMPRARGSAAPIRKRCSHVSIILDVKGSVSTTKSPVATEAAPAVSEKKEAVKPARKTSVKKPAAKKVTSDKK